MKFIPSPTGKRFIKSRAPLKIIMGPVGGGKSTVCMMDLLSRAFNQEPHKGVRRTKFAIVRNTSDQLKQTVKPLIDEWLVTMQIELHGAPLGEWKLTEKTFQIRTDPAPDGTRIECDIMLMNADTPEDVKRLLSLQLSAAWVEEAREIDAEVFKGLVGRVNRFPSMVAGGVTQPGVICSTNAPMVDTYWHKMIDSLRRRGRTSRRRAAR